MESAVTRGADESQPQTPRIVPLTAAKISECNSALEKIFSDMEEYDAIFGRSLKFKCLTSTAFAPYAEMLRDLRQKAKHTRLPQFLESVWKGKLPTPSTSHEGQIPELALTNIDLLPSSSSAEEVPPPSPLVSMGNQVEKFNHTVHCSITHPAAPITVSF